VIRERHDQPNLAENSDYQIAKAEQVPGRVWRLRSESSARISLAFDLSLFGLLLFGHVAAPPQSTGTNSGGNAFLPFGIVT
jgi:hypothetical protein